MQQYLKNVLAKLLNHRGYELKIKADPPRGFDNFLQFAKRNGLAPHTVFDIGVGTGTPWLYRNFPNTKFVLIEALDVFEPALRQLTQTMDAEYHILGVGEKAETRTILMSENVPTSSSLHDVHQDRLAFQTNVSIERVHKPIEIRPLDMIADHAAPYLIKLDIEGAELAALRGAVRSLQRTQMVIIEVSVMRRYEGEGSFAEIVGFLHQQGFRLYDIIELNQLGADGPLSYIDAAFVPEGFPRPSLPF
jgi:FkbM family methyltransferase